MTLIDFIHDVTWEDIPEDVREQARRCFLDTMGVAVGGRVTSLTDIIYDFVAQAYGGNQATLWMDGRSCSIPGVVLAHGMGIDALDMHDSCRPVKGHAGVAQVPAALATLGMGNGPIDGEEFLTTLAMAYDVSIRSGTALHATACDYHTSGAWNALGTAAIVARRMGLSKEQTRHALGIAEYHGPRSQMMRCIDHPTMLKDGSGWGAMAGISAGMMASAGFTGAPAITVEAPEVEEYYADLGQRWSLMIQYFKPYAVCYWAQPAIACALSIQKKHNLSHADIKAVRVHTFHESFRLATRFPKTTEEAQYSLPFPIAAALVHGRLDYPQIHGDALNDQTVIDLVHKVELIDDDAFNARFPADRLSRVYIDTNDGRTLDSGEMRSLWDLTAPPTNAELIEKFRNLVKPLGADRAAKLEDAVWNVHQLDDVDVINQLMIPPA